MAARQRLAFLARWCVLALSLLVGVAAHAVFPVPGSQTEYRANSSYPWTTSREAACTAYVADQSAANSSFEIAFLSVDGSNGCHASFTSRSSGAVVSPDNVVITLATRVAEPTCPANSTAVAGGCQCKAGSVESGNACVPNQCAQKANIPQTVNVTICFTRTPDDNDTKCVGAPFNPWGGANICAGGCEMKMGEGTAAWVSQTPSPNGLYRNSVDATYLPTGAACTPSQSNPGDKAADKDAPPEPCPGAVGEVNGKLGCYGTASNPVVTQPKVTADQAVLAGNPAAGPKPLTGEGSGSGGSGRTPGTGNGTATGGPAAAAKGSKGNGSGGAADGTGRGIEGPAGTEQANCGAPGQPKCSINEDGTKDDEKGETWEIGGKSQRENGDKARSAMVERGTKTLEWVTSTDPAKRMQWDKYTWTFQLPTGCTNIDMGALNLTLDICKYQPMFHTIMTFVWLCVGIFGAWGMVGRAQTDA